MTKNVQLFVKSMCIFIFTYHEFNLVKINTHCIKHFHSFSIKQHLIIPLPKIRINYGRSIKCSGYFKG